MKEERGCEREPDELGAEGGGSGCVQCAMHSECAAPGHGHYYIGGKPDRGAPALGFRTDRCPWAWTQTDWVHAVGLALWWADRPGGGLALHLGEEPAAMLMDGIVVLGRERRAVEADHFKQPPKPVAPPKSPRGPWGQVTFGDAQ